MIAPEPPTPVAVPPSESELRAQLRLKSIGWALLAGISAGLISLVWGLEAVIRSGGCGLFYGLLAFHLQRVDPDDSHLQAGLVGAICGVRSLGMPCRSSVHSRQPISLAPYVGSSCETGLPCSVIVARCRKGSSSVPTVSEPPCATKMYEQLRARSTRSKMTAPSIRRK